jgi:NTP pyrophosphatase (non-canonical NTP hydrolase)
MSLNRLSKQHHAWVERMQWHLRTHLEAAGMIGSEIGEACAEVHFAEVSEHFGVELADVVLRCVDMAIEIDSDIDIVSELKLIEKLEPAYQSLEHSLIKLFALQAPLVNAARQSDSFAILDALMLTMQACFSIARRQGIDLLKVMEKKVEANAMNGSKGRLK